MPTLISSPAWADTQRGGPLIHIPPPYPPVYTHVGHARNHGIGRRGYSIRFIIAHTTESDTTIPNCLLYDSYRSELVSCTAFTGTDGVGYDVPEPDRPFTTGRWNDESLSNEIIGKAAWTRDAWLQRQQTIVNTVNLWTDWCIRFNIPPMWIANPADILLPTTRGIFDHRLGNQAAILEVPSRATSPSYSHIDVGAGMRDIIVNIIIPLVVENLVQPIPPTNGDNVNTARIIKFKSYQNQFLVGAGPAMNLTPELARSYIGADPATGTPIPGYPQDQIVPFMIVADHPTAIKSCLYQAGLTQADLAPG